MKRFQAVVVALALVCVTTTEGVAHASINSTGCVSGQEGCVKFVLWDDTTSWREYSYIVPSYPQSQYLRLDNGWTIVKYVRNRTRPFFITFGSSGWAGSGCEARVQDSQTYVFNENIAIYAADAAVLPFGCSSF